MNAALLWKIDECAPYFERMKVRGWCFAPGARIGRVDLVFDGGLGEVPLRSYGLESGDVAAHVSPEAARVRFDEWIPLADAQRGVDFTLRCTLADGNMRLTGSAHGNCREGDAGHGCWYRFLREIATFPEGDVLEIGSRARSGVTRRDCLPRQLGYVGFDVLAGPNVDVVGDAHELSRHFPPGRFAAVMSLAVFEHLAMPWKAVIEINRVLRTGGLVFVNTPQTWPVHEVPWDFWRFTAYAWSSLFNAATGFEIIETAHGEPARVHPLWDSPVARDMPASPAYLISTVIARKTSDTALRWDVPTSVAAPGQYPEGVSAVDGRLGAREG